MEHIVDVLAEILLIVPFLGTLATIFLWRIYLSDTARPRSWVLFVTAVSSTIVSIAGWAISTVAIVRLSGQSIGEQGGLVLAFVLLVLECLPIWYAVEVWRRRRQLSKVPTSSSEE